MMLSPEVFAALSAPELLGAMAERHGLLRATPEAGDLFLQFSPARGEFIRAGVIARVYDDRPTDADYWDIVSIERRTEDDDESQQEQPQRIVRRLSSRRGDRFLRWRSAVR